MDSTGDTGADYDLTCTEEEGCAADDGTCDMDHECDYDDVVNPAVLEICAGDTGCDFVESAGHGRIIWNYVDRPVNFGVDEPRMVFTGRGDLTLCAEDSDDIIEAGWDTGGDWDVPSTSPCPDSVVTDRHDPGVIPLPEEEFKMYVRGDEMNVHHYVHYWDGSTWDEGRFIAIYFDDETTFVPEQCLENGDAIVFPGTPPKEGLFFRASPEPGCFDVGGIVFAEHIN